MAQESGKVAAEIPTVPRIAPASPPASPTTDELRARIEHTRAEMTETIDAIQDRLAPGRIVSDVSEKVKGATIDRVRTIADRTAGGAADASRTTVQTIKAHPIAAAVAGGAAAALIAGVLWRSRNGSSVHARRSTEPTARGNRTPSTGFGRNKRTLFLGACTGLACWNAWRLRHEQGAHRPAMTIPIGDSGDSAIL